MALAAGVQVAKGMELTQDVPEVPTEPSIEVRILRAKLIFEEAMETIAKGLGVGIVVSGTKGWIPLNYHLMANMEEPEFKFAMEWDFDMTETIDGCCDISVVTTGTLSACGVPDEPFLNIVDKNNIDKYGPGCTIREDGKVIKPPGHKAPDIHGLLASLYHPEFGSEVQ